MSKIKKLCYQYLGNRGVYQSIKRCAKYNNMWFIIFSDYPDDVEISFNSYCYECYDEISSNEMKWNKSFYQEVKNKIDQEKLKRVA